MPGARGTGLAATAWLSLVAATGCSAATAPSRDPQAVLRPLLAEVNGLSGPLGGARIVDGPRRVRCHMGTEGDRTVRWQLFARAPATASTSAAVAKIAADRRAAGWTVDEPPAGAETSVRMRRGDVFLTLTFLKSGRGDVVLAGETACFTPAPGG